MILEWHLLPAWHVLTNLQSSVSGMLFVDKYDADYASCLRQAYVCDMFVMHAWLRCLRPCGWPVMVSGPCLTDWIPLLRSV